MRMSSSAAHDCRPYLTSAHIVHSVLHSTCTGLHVNIDPARHKACGSAHSSHGIVCLQGVLKIEPEQRASMLKIHGLVGFCWKICQHVSPRTLHYLNTVKALINAAHVV